MPGLSRRKLADHAAKSLADGEPTASVLEQLAAYLIDTKRTAEAELITRDIQTALLQHGIALVTAVSARELSAESRTDITAYTKQLYEHVSRVEIQEQIDTSLIGGVKLLFPDQQLDTSIKHTLDKLTV